MQKNLSKIPLLIAAAFFVASLAGFLFLHNMTESARHDSLAKEEKWQDETWRRDEIKRLDLLIKEMALEVARLETHFVQSSDVVPFLDTLEGLAARSGVKAEIVSVDIIKDRVGLLVSMRSSGSFSGLYKLITLLENSTYELEFLELQIKKGSGFGLETINASAPSWDAFFRIQLLSFIP